MNHLLINCDVEWMADKDSFVRSLARFDKISFEEPGRNFFQEYTDSLETVTHWIVNPAPKQTIDLALVTYCFPNLRWIGSPSTGTTHIAESLKASNAIKVVSLRNVDKNQLRRITASSEYTLFLYLAVLRRLKNWFSMDLMSWRDNLHQFRGRQAAGQKALILGYGRIGSNLSRYLKALGLDVFVFEIDTSVSVGCGVRVGEENLLRVLSDVDVVFLCFHWSAERHQFFDSKMLDAMGCDSILINTSRGENLDEKYLCELLRHGKFAGVGLDVIQGEQSESLGEHQLMRLASELPRLVITPHIAGASFDSERIALELIIAEAEKCF